MSRSNPQVPPIPSSLREQIEAIEYWQGTDGSDFPEDVFGGLPDEVVDQIMSLVTTYIETAEIDRAIAETDWFIEIWNKTVKDGSYPTHAVLEKHADDLQAQKAVLEEK